MTSRNTISLKRYSKPHGAGDQTSGGRGKLLKSNSNLSRTELLVRETLQNSWDAREQGWYPAFGIRLHKLSPETRAILLKQVFTETDHNLDKLRQSLNNEDCHVLEIYDRGTVGLNGPVHPSKAPEPGEPNNFTPLVFDIGTTKTAEGSGGTYGFGKTAAFEASAAHAVVYWSATSNRQDELEHRLIAASLHEPYHIGGKRYTGAHWWGVPSEGAVIPLTGSDAEELGEKLFHTHFGFEEDGDPEKGTSILIIDPIVSIKENNASEETRVAVRTREHVETLLQQLKEAIARHAWPKFILDEQDEPPMSIELLHDELALEIEELDVAEYVDQNYGDYGYSLAQIRKEQGTDYADDSPALARNERPLTSQTFDIVLGKTPLEDQHGREKLYGKRDSRLVGHLHLFRYANLDAASATVAPMRSVALMRSLPELVVSYEKFGIQDDDIITWHGVFKPVPEVDHHFGATEPPTHDAWVPNNAESEVSSSVVDRTLKAIKRRVSEFLGQSIKAEGVQGISVRKIARSLAGFMPVGAPADDNREAPSQRQQSPAGARQKDYVTVLQAIDVKAQSRGQVQGSSPAILQDIYFEVSQSAPGDIRLSISVEAQTASGKMPLSAEDNDFSATWFKTFESQPLQHQPTFVPCPPNDTESLIVPPGFKGKVRLSVEDPVDALVKITGEPASMTTEASKTPGGGVR